MPLSPPVTLMVLGCIVVGMAMAAAIPATKSRAVVTAVRTTGVAREDYLEVELDLMVSRPRGGQFPAHQTALIPEVSLPGLTPGSVIDVYFRRRDESVIAVRVPPD